jgi:hypothetical protein
MRLDLGIVDQIFFCPKSKALIYLLHNLTYLFKRKAKNETPFVLLGPSLFIKPASGLLL